MNTTIDFYYSCSLFSSSSSPINLIRSFAEQSRQFLCLIPERASADCLLCYYRQLKNDTTFDNGNMYCSQQQQVTGTTVKGVSQKRFDCVTKLHTIQTTIALIGKIIVLRIRQTPFLSKTIIRLHLQEKVRSKQKKKLSSSGATFVVFTTSRDQRYYFQESETLVIFNFLKRRDSHL